MDETGDPGENHRRSLNLVDTLWVNVLHTFAGGDLLTIKGKRMQAEITKEMNKVDQESHYRAFWTGLNNLQLNWSTGELISLVVWFKIHALLVPLESTILDELYIYKYID